MTKLLDWILKSVHHLIEHYVEPIRGDQIALGGILAGNVSLQDIQVKQKILDFCPVPLQLQFNYIGRVQFSIPFWTFLTNPIRAVVEDVVLVVSTKNHKEWSKAHFEDSFVANKRAVLATGEATTFLNSFEDGFIWRTALRIGRGAKIQLKNVHIRFEDWYSSNDGGSALGIHIAEISVKNLLELDRTVDEIYKNISSLAGSDANIIRKEIKILDLSVYCESLNFPRGSPVPGKSVQADINVAKTPHVYSMPSHRLEGIQLNNKAIASPESRQQQASETQQPVEDLGIFQNLLKWVGWTKDTAAQPDSATSVDGQKETSKRQWKSDTVVQSFKLDGRLPYRDLFAEFCDVRLYDPIDDHWKDAQELLNLVQDLNQRSTNVFGGNQNRAVVREARQIDDLLRLQQLDLLEKYELSQTPKNVAPKDPLNHDPAREYDLQMDPEGFREQFNKRYNFKNGVQLPSLRVRAENISEVRLLVRDLAKAYHDFIIRPRELSVALSLSLIPVISKGKPVVSTTQTSRDYVVKQIKESMYYTPQPEPPSPQPENPGKIENSQEEHKRNSAGRKKGMTIDEIRDFIDTDQQRKEIQISEGQEQISPQEEEEIFQPATDDSSGGHILPMCRIDLHLDGARMTINSDQVKSLLSLAEVYGNLFPLWSSAIQANLESARPPFDEAQLYLDAWLVKVAHMQGIPVPETENEIWLGKDLTLSQKRIIKWCDLFERNYTSDAINALRREAILRWREFFGTGILSLYKSSAINHQAFLECCRRPSMDCHCYGKSSSLPPHQASEILTHKNPISRAKNQVGIRVKSRNHGLLNDIWELVEFELLNCETLKTAGDKFKKFQFSNDVTVKMLISDFQLFICLRDNVDLAVMLEGANIEINMESTRTVAGEMVIDSAIWPVTVASVTGFQPHIGPVASSESDEDAIQRATKALENREKLLKRLAQGRMTGEDVVARFYEGAFMRRKRQTVKAYTSVKTSSDAFQLVPLLLIGRTGGSFVQTTWKSQRKRDRFLAAAQMFEGRKIWNTLLNKTTDDDSKKNPLEFKEKLPSILFTMISRPYRLPDIADMEIRADVLAATSIVVPIQVISDLIISAVPILDALGTKDLLTLYDICQEVSVLHGRDFIEKCTVGDLPHSSVVFDARVHQPIQIMIATPTSEDIPTHLNSEGLIARIDPLSFNTVDLKPRKNKFEAMRLPAQDQRDVFEIVFGALSVQRCQSILNALCGPESPNYYLGGSSAVHSTVLADHYKSILAAGGTNLSPAGTPPAIEPTFADMAQTCDERSYLIYPMTFFDKIKIELYHLPLREEMPALHLDAHIDRLAIEINTYDIVLFVMLGNAATQFQNPLNIALANMANSMAHAEYIVQTVKPKPRRIVAEDLEIPISQPEAAISESKSRTRSASSTLGDFFGKWFPGAKSGTPENLAETPKPADDTEHLESTACRRRRSRSESTDNYLTATAELTRVPEESEFASPYNSNSIDASRNSFTGMTAISNPEPSFTQYHIVGRAPDSNQAESEVKPPLRDRQRQNQATNDGNASESDSPVYLKRRNSGNSRGTDAYFPVYNIDDSWYFSHMDRTSVNSVTEGDSPFSPESRNETMSPARVDAIKSEMTSQFRLNEARKEKSSSSNDTVRFLDNNDSPRSELSSSSSFSRKLSREISGILNDKDLIGTMRESPGRYESSGVERWCRLAKHVSFSRRSSHLRSLDSQSKSQDFDDDELWVETTTPMMLLHLGLKSISLRMIQMDRKLSCTHDDFPRSRQTRKGYTYEYAPFGYDLKQRGFPLVSLHLNEIKMVMCIAKSMDLEFSIDNMKIMDDMGICDMNFSSLYSSSEFIHGFGFDRATALQKKMARNLISDCHRGCRFGYCLQRHMNKTLPHIMVSIKGDLDATLRVRAEFTPIRLVFPLEVLDQISAFVLELNAILATVNTGFELTGLSQIPPPFTPEPIKGLPFPYKNLLEQNPTESRKLILKSEISIDVPSIEILIPVEPIRLPERCSFAKKAKFREDSAFQFSARQKSLISRVANQWVDVVKKHVIAGKHEIYKKSVLPLCFAVRFGITFECNVFTYGIYPYPTLNFHGIPNVQHSEYETLSKSTSSLDPFTDLHHTRDSFDKISPASSKSRSTTPKVARAHQNSRGSETRLNESTPQSVSLASDTSIASSRKLFRVRSTVEAYRWVERCVRSPVAPNAAVRAFFPGEIDTAIHISGVCMDFVRPYPKLKLRFPRVYWEPSGIRYGAACNEIPNFNDTGGRITHPLLKPFDIDFTINVRLPSERQCWERYYGFSRQEAMEVRKLFGVNEAVEPESASLRLTFSDINVDLKTENITNFLLLSSLTTNFIARELERTERLAYLTEIIQRARTAQRVEDSSSPGGRSDAYSASEEVTDANSSISCTFCSASSTDLVMDKEEDFTEWLLAVGVPPTLSAGLFQYNLMTSFESFELTVDMNEIAISLLNDRDSRLIAVRAEELTINLKTLAFSSNKYPPPWWLEINSIDDVLAGADLIALSFVSYDFEPLRNNPYQTRPVRQYGLYHVVRDVIMAALKAYQVRNQKSLLNAETALDDSFRGSITEVRRKISKFMPWIAFEINLTISMTNANPKSETAFLVEPSSITILGGKRGPDTNIHSTIEISWINITISVHLLQTLLLLVQDILARSIPEALNRLNLPQFQNLHEKRLRTAVVQWNRNTPFPKFKLQPSFLSENKHLCQAQLLFLGSNRCPQIQMTPTTHSSHQYYMRPPGTFEPHAVLLEQLTALTKILGNGFFNTGRTQKIVRRTLPSIFPSPFPKPAIDVNGEPRGPAKLASVVDILVGDLLEKNFSESGDKELLNIVNLLGQTLCVYYSGSWHDVMAGERIFIPVGVEGNGSVDFPHFNIRFRLMNDVFDLDTENELKLFRTYLLQYIQELSTTAKVANADDSSSKSIFQTYTLNLNAVNKLSRSQIRRSTVPRKTKKPSGYLTCRGRRPRAKKSTIGPGPGDARQVVNRLFKLYSKAVEIRGSVPLLVRMSPVAHTTNRQSDSHRGLTSSPFVFELILSSPFSVKNTTGDQVMIVHSTPSSQEKRKDVETPPEIASNLDSNLLKDSPLTIETSPAVSFDDWIYSHECVSVLLRLPPPKPPLEPLPRLSYSTSSTSAVNLHNKLVKSNSTLDTRIHLRGVEAFVDYLRDDDAPGLAAGQSAGPGSAAAPGSAAGQSAGCHQDDIRSRILAKYEDLRLCDGITSLILSPNQACDEIEQYIAEQNYTSPPMWPRPVPLHWLLWTSSELICCDCLILRQTQQGEISPMKFSPASSPVVSPSADLRNRSPLNKVRQDSLNGFRISNLNIVMTIHSKSSAIFVPSRNINLVLNTMPQLLQNASDVGSLKRLFNRIDLAPRLVIIKTISHEHLVSQKLLVQSDKLRLPSAEHAAPSSNGRYLVSFHDDNFQDSMLENTFTSTASLIANDLTKSEGCGIAFEFVISPLFMICNRLPRTLGITNLRLNAHGMGKLKNLFQNADPELSKQNALSEDRFAQATGSGPPIGQMFQNILLRNYGEMTNINYVPTGANVLLPLSEINLQFSFGNLVTHHPVNVDIGNTDSQILDIKLKRRKKKRGQIASNPATGGISDVREASASNIDSEYDYASTGGDEEYSNGGGDSHEIKLYVEVTKGSGCLEGSSLMDGLKVEGKSLCRSLTVFTEVWFVNRLDYPLLMRWKMNTVLAPHKRTVMSSEVQKLKEIQLFFSIRHVELIPGSRYYHETYSGDKLLWRKFGGGYNGIYSDAFKISGYSSVATPVTFCGTDKIPSLSLILWSTRSPPPFMRTTTVEVLPAYLLSNDRPYIIYVRESPYEKKFTGEVTVSVGAFLAIPPGSKIEFHPQKGKKKEIWIQISACPEVEKFHQVIVKASPPGKYNKAHEINYDAPLWSAPMLIHNAQVFQLRHPTDQSPTISVGKFDLTEISVTVRNGVRLVRFLNPDIPEYRLLNRSNYALAIAQHKVGGPFEILKPSPKKEQDSSAQTQQPFTPTMFTDLSMPYNIYDPSGGKKLDIWVISGGAKRKTAKTNATSEDRKANQLSDGKGYTKALIMKNRREQKWLGDGSVEDARETLRTAVMKIVGREAKSSMRELEAVMYTIDTNMNDDALVHWGEQRDTHARFFDLVNQFDLDKKRKISSDSHHDRLILMPVPHTSAIVPIRIKLRFISGVKWIIFEDYQGSVSAFEFRRSAGAAGRAARLNGVKIPEPYDRLNDAAREDDNQASVFDKRREINILYLEAQRCPEKIEAIMTLLKYDELAVDEMCRIWRFGGREIRVNFAQRYESRFSKSWKETMAEHHRDLEAAKDIDDEERLSDAEGPAGLRSYDDAYDILANDGSTSAVAVDGKPEQRELIETEQVELNWNLGIDLRIVGFGIDIIDNITWSDLIYIAVAKIALVVEIRGEEVRLICSLGWLQIDNSLKNAYYPTVIRPIVDLHASTMSYPRDSGQFKFNNPQLFERDILTRFGAPSHFEIFRFHLENRLSSSISDPEDFLSRLLNSVGSDKVNGRSAAPTSPEKWIVLHFNAIDIEVGNQNTNFGAVLLDISLCDIQFSPLAINVDLPLITAILMMMDKAIQTLDDYSITYLNSDALEIQESETSSVSPAWKKYLGPADVLINTQPQLGKMSITALDVGKIKMVLNINITNQSPAAARGPGVNTPTASIEEIMPRNRNNQDDTELLGNAIYTIKRDDEEVPPQLFMLQGDNNLAEEFNRENSSSALPAEDNVVVQPQTELVRSILSALKLQASMSDAQISLPGMCYRDLSGPSDELIFEILSPYITKAAKQAAKVLGAIDLLGNPGLVVRHIAWGFYRALKEIRVGCFSSRTQYQRLHPDNIIYSRIFYQPCSACFYSFVYVFIGCASGALELMSRCFGSWYNIMEQCSRNSDNYSIFPERTTERFRKGPITEQPASVLEGVIRGVRAGVSVFGISIINVFVKPIRGCLIGKYGLRDRYEEINRLRRLDLLDPDDHHQPAVSALSAEENEEHVTCSDRINIFAKHCCLGIFSSGCSCLCGTPGSLCICCGLTTSGALHNLVKVPMLQSLRYPRIFFKHQNNTFLNLFEHDYSYWNSYAGSPTKIARFLKLKHPNEALRNIILAVPLSSRDLLTNHPVPAILLVGSQRVALMYKHGIKWHFPWKKLTNIEFVGLPKQVVVDSQNTANLNQHYCFIRFVMQPQKSDTKVVFLLPCLGFDSGYFQFLQVSSILTHGAV